MIDWENIDNVFLDMDGTLLDLNFDNHFWQDYIPERYARANGLDKARAKTLLEPRFKAMEGRLEWYCLDYWTEQLKLDIAGLKTEVAGLIAVLPHVVEFLEAARQAGKRLILVTNAHRKSLGLKMEKTCLKPFFHHIVSSHDLGAPKEDARFWHELNVLQAFDKRRTLMVDDSLAVLRAARNYGISQVIAVSWHDTTRPARHITEFPSIRDFREIMPARHGA
jgi:5'-nucleotidase